MQEQTPQKLTHIDEQGRAKMVDISEKSSTSRLAVASASLFMKAETLALIMDGKIKKGDVFATARIAGIQAAKKCADLIPLCHPLMLSSVEVHFEADTGQDEKQHSLTVFAHCKVEGKTGVEMEALTAASVAALTIYDMCKAVEKGITIQSVQLLEKSGGKSGNFSR